MIRCAYVTTWCPCAYLKTNTSINRHVYEENIILINIQTNATTICHIITYNIEYYE